MSRVKEKTNKVMEREAGGDGFSPGQTGNSLGGSLREEITSWWGNCVVLGEQQVKFHKCALKGEEMMI